MASGVGCLTRGLTEAPDLMKATRRRVGRPRKHSEGWESANKRICIL